MPESDCCRFNLSVVWGSVANTMPSAFWLLYYIICDENAKKAILTEVQNVISKRQKGEEMEPFTIDELDQMISIQSAFTETLRLRSESLIARDVAEDCVLDLKIPGTEQYCLRKGSRVVIYPSMLHYDDSVFEDPESFRWDRFLPNRSGEKPIFKKNGKVIATPVKAFGGGASMCPGRKFASIEVKSFVAILFRQFELSIQPIAGGSMPPSPKVDSSRVGLGIVLPIDDILVEFRKR